MRVSKFIHSCVLVQKDDSAILFDPGKFSFIEKQVRPQDFHGLNAIILTHGHPDHVDSDALSEIFSANPTAIVYGNQETAAGLRLMGIEVTPFETGTRQMGAFAVEAIAAEHAPIHRTCSAPEHRLPARQNSAEPGGLVLGVPGSLRRHRPPSFSL